MIKLFKFYLMELVTVYEVTRKAFLNIGETTN